MTIRYERTGDAKDWWIAWIDNGYNPTSWEGAHYGGGRSLRAAIGNLVETSMRQFGVDDIAPTQKERDNMEADHILRQEALLHGIQSLSAAEVERQNDYDSRTFG